MKIRVLFFGLSSLFALMINPALAQQKSCPQKGLYLQVLGSGGPEMTDGRTSTSYLLWQDGKAKFLIDAGAGAAWRFEQSGAKFEDLEAVLFTHFHVDHSSDFPAFVKAGFFSSRNKDLAIYGPDNQGKNRALSNTTQFVERLFNKETGVYPYLSSFFDASSRSAFHYIAHNIPINNKEIYVIKKPEYSLSAVSVEHGPLPAVAWRIDIEGKSVSFSGDMNGSQESLDRLAKNTDLLVAHDAINEHTHGAGAFLHMKPVKIGEIAKNAKAKSVVLSHFMNRSLGREKEARKAIAEHYSGKVDFATDLSCWEVR